MNELIEIEQQMKVAMVAHKMSIISSVTKRLFQLGFTFKTRTDHNNFFKDRILFEDVPYENNTKVWLDDEKVIMTVRTNPDIDIMD